jgi:hypothetical protein
MATVVAILNALAAIPAILGYVETFASAVTLWYVQRASAQTQAAISDAAALAARATTDAERYAAAQNWQTVLSRPRVTSS